jgi:hypothetical protein
MNSDGVADDPDRTRDARKLLLRVASSGVTIILKFLS